MRRAWIALAALATACGQTAPAPPPLGQLVLYVDTDAPVPSSVPQPPDPMTPSPLFDRLRVDVLEPGGSPCSACTREFDVFSEDLRAGRVSVGIVPTPGVSGYVARVRLFGARFVPASGEPDPATTIDVSVALPVVDATGIVEATVLLSTDDVAAPVTSPITPAPGPPGASAVGTWPGAARVACTTTAGTGEVCVPGGAFWTGNPLAFNLPPSMPLSPRLVVLSPFLLDATEVTVSAFRGTGHATPWSGGTSGTVDTDFCTFTATSGPFEKYPVDCLSWQQAHAYCVARGRDLPSEAQFEYVAGGLLGQFYPWGNDAPSCTQAVYARGGWGGLVGDNTLCMPAKSPGGPLAVGSGSLDRLDLPTGTLLDLSGNVSEWARDTWNRPDEPCWSRLGIYHDPLCSQTSPADGAMQVTMSGNWLDLPAGLEATARLAATPTNVNIVTGLRCGRADGM